MFLTIASAIFGSSNERTIKKFQKIVDKINAFEEDISKLNNPALQAKTPEFKNRLQNGETLDDILPEAFAVVRETAKRVMGQRHYDVQLIGGLTLHNGMIAEMKTGEGKTLVSTLAAYLNALTGEGVHVVTVNDYLAKRDSEWMSAIYNFLGLSVGCITADITEEERARAYQCDITYGTNNEFGFDYLRDNMKFRPENLVQKEFSFAIIDEVDSILVDEARTPLIISGPADTSSELYVEVNKLIPLLDEADYDHDEKTRNIMLSDIGAEHSEELMKEHGLLTEGGLYDAQNIALVHHLNQSLRAHKIYHKDKDYIIHNGHVVLIDEFTGRMMEGRRLSDGLHQAIEAKEGVDIQQENQTLASITFQNYFRLYPKLGGMTGTAMTEAAEFEEIYNLKVVSIPTHVPIARQDHNDQIYKSAEDKFEAIVVLIKECHDRNQPVLVGTTSIEKSELLSTLLKKNKIAHQVLNARYHEQEASIVAQAGRPGAVTIATNMAGRGTDIQLGGNLDMRIEQEVDPTWTEDHKQKVIEAIKAEIDSDKQTVLNAGGLYVIGTERHESRRIDNQLRGRSGRQGDPGASLFFLSLDDDLMRIFGAERLEPLLANRSIGLKEGEALTHPLISKTLERAQMRVEQQNFEIRRSLLKFDNVMNDQRKVIYEQRREIMNGIGVEDTVKEMRHDIIEDMTERFMPPGSYADQWDTESLSHEVDRVLNLDVSIKDWAAEEGIAQNEVFERLIEASDKLMANKAATYTPEIMRKLEKGVLLQRLDHHWKDHLLALDHLRQGINLRAMGQRDPLNEYKAEAFALFQQMLASIAETTTETLSRVEINIDRGATGLVPQSNMQETKESRIDPAMQNADTQGDDQGTRIGGGVVKQVKKVAFNQEDPDTWAATPRNALCPCGSGKKYKHCHGVLAKTGS